MRGRWLPTIGAIFGVAGCHVVLGIEQLEEKSPGPGGDAAAGAAGVSGGTGGASGGTGGASGGTGGIGGASGTGGAGGASGGSAGSGAQSYAAVVLADNPIAYWRLDEDAATSLIAKDATGNHDGDYLGTLSAAPTAIANDPGRAVFFQAGAMVVSDSTQLDFAGTQAFSLEAWVKPTTIDSNYRRVAGKRLTGQGYSVYVQEINGCCFERYRDGTNSTVCHSIVADVYSHVVAVYEPGWLRLYINAAPPAQGGDKGLGLLAIADSLRLGSFNPSYGNPLLGSLDEVAVYDYALEPAQIQKHHQAGLGNF